MLKISHILLVFSFFTLNAMEQSPGQRIVKRKLADLEETDSTQANITPHLIQLVNNPENRERKLLPELVKTESAIEQSKTRLSSVVVRVEKEQKKEKKESTARFIYDDYTARRGEPKMLEIKCAQCNNHVISYQKDGPGALLRCYLDRIHAPSHLRKRQYHRFDVRRSPLLNCEYCRSTIGIPMIYQLENRPAYRMLKNKFYY